MAMQVARRARAMRLAANLSRKTLAAKSGVTEASIKRFEQSGEIAFVSLLKIAHVLGDLAVFEHAFTPREFVTLDDIVAKPRSRGRA